MFVLYFTSNSVTLSVLLNSDEKFILNNKSIKLLKIKLA